MEKPLQLIPQINPESRNWAVRVTIIEEIPTITCSNAAKLKRYVLADEEGNEVIGAVYGRDVAVMYPMIHLFEVYDISNAEVKRIPENFQILDNPFQWNIKRETLIRPVPQAIPNLRYFLDSLTPFSLIFANNEAFASTNNNKLKTADVMGILIHADQVRHVKEGQSRVQHFTIIDPERIPLCISIWDEMVESQGQLLFDATKTNSVLIAKRLAIKTFNCISLSSKNCSSFAIDPPIEAVANLKNWFSTLSDSEKQNLLSNKTVDNTKQLALAGRMKTFTIAELTTTAQAGDYWVRGYLRLTDENQRLYYVVCPACENKVRSDPGHEYICFLCKQRVTATMRLIVILSAVDYTTITQVAAMQEVAERILQTTAHDMSRLVYLGQRLELESIKSSLEGRTFLMYLRRCYGETLDLQRRILLLDFCDDSVTAANTLPQIDCNSSTSDNKQQGSSSEAKDSDNTLSPLKRQMSQIIINSDCRSKRQILAEEDTGPATET